MDKPKMPKKQGTSTDMYGHKEAIYGQGVMERHHAAWEAYAAQLEARLRKVRGLVEKWLVEVEKYAGTHAYVEGMRKCADELAAALSAKGENEDTTHER